MQQKFVYDDVGNEYDAENNTDIEVSIPSTFGKQRKEIMNLQKSIILTLNGVIKEHAAASVLMIDGEKKEKRLAGYREKIDLLLDRAKELNIKLEKNPESGLYRLPQAKFAAMETEISLIVLVENHIENFFNKLIHDLTVQKETSTNSLSRAMSSISIETLEETKNSLLLSFKDLFSKTTKITEK